MVSFFSFYVRFVHMISSIHSSERAAAELMIKRFEEALADSVKATSIDPNFARGHSRAGKAALSLGRMAEAEVCTLMLISSKV